jgi:two-component system alkaline phosphatase synthesis response regulator PhoP
MIEARAIKSVHVGEIPAGLRNRTAAPPEGVMNILIVEDEPDLTELLTYRLKKEGFQVSSAVEGWEALRRAEEIYPDLILLDIGIPGLNGIEVCKWLRRHPKLKKCAVFMLTARGAEADQVAGFDAGADDYLVKPLSPTVLISRIQALRRRLKNERVEESTKQQLRVGNLLVDDKRFVVMRVTDGSTEAIHFPRKEFKLLHFLASQPGIVFSRDQLLDEVWEHDASVSSRTVDVHVNKIRKKIGDEWIETVTGVGYRFRE